MDYIFSRAHSFQISNPWFLSHLYLNSLPPCSVPKQTWNQSISAKKSPSHLLDLGKIKPLYVGQFKQPLVLAKLKSRLKWASRNSISRCPIWPLVLAQHWANTGLVSLISPVYVNGIYARDECHAMNLVSWIETFIFIRGVIIQMKPLKWCRPNNIFDK